MKETGKILTLKCKCGVEYQTPEVSLFSGRHLRPKHRHCPECQKEWDKLVTAQITVIGEIKKSGKQHGIIECPICKKNIGFTVSPSNGHILGKCETENCLAWIM